MQFLDNDFLISARVSGLSTINPGKATHRTQQPAAKALILKSCQLPECREGLNWNQDLLPPTSKPSPNETHQTTDHLASRNTLIPEWNTPHLHCHLLALHSLRGQLYVLDNCTCQHLFYTDPRSYVPTI